MKNIEQNLRQIEQQVAELITVSAHLQRDNQKLRAELDLLRHEFKALQDKNRIAQKRVEQIVARLKSMQST